MIYVAYNTENIIFISSVKAVKKSWCLNNTKEVTIFDDITAFYSNLAKKGKYNLQKYVYGNNISKIVQTLSSKVYGYHQTKIWSFYSSCFLRRFCKDKKMCK